MFCSLKMDKVKYLYSREGGEKGFTKEQDIYA